MSIEVFNRVEEKYIVTKAQYEKMVSLFGTMMKCDEYSKNGKFYQICNIYYDTADNNLIRTSLLKPRYKEKFRLRSYGTPKEDTKVFLEVKKKYNGIVNKRRSTLSLQEAYEFTDTNVIPEIKPYMNEQVLKELRYSLSLYKLQPKVFISYERRAFFGAEDDSFRVTFDRNIITRRYDVALEKGVYGEKLIKDNTMILEVKYTERMPLWFIAIIRKLGLEKGSFSKYGTEYNRFLANKKMEYNDMEVVKYA